MPDGEYPGHEAGAREPAKEVMGRDTRVARGTGEVARTLHQLWRSGVSEQALDQALVREELGECGVVATSFGKLRRSSRMSGRGRKVLQHSHEGYGEAAFSVGSDGWLVDRLSERLCVEGRRDPEIGPEGVGAGQPGERLGAVRSGGRGSDGLLEQDLRPGRVAGLEVMPGCLNPQRESFLGQFGRDQMESLLGELRGGVGGTSRPSPRRRLLERRGHLLVGGLRRQGEVACALLDVLDDLGQPAVEAATPLRA